MLASPPGTGLERLGGPWNTVAVGFLTEKGRRTGSRGTVEVYGRIVGRFLETVAHPADATPLDVHRFAYGFGPDGIVPSASTIAGRLSAVSSFYDFAVRMEVIEKNPVANVRRPSVGLGPPRGLSDDEVVRLLAVIPETPTGLLDRAITITALLTGLRRSELMDLRIADAVPGEPVRYEVRTKGGAMRRRELPEPAWQAIRTAHAALGNPVPLSRTPVFPISDATYYAHLRRYGEAADLGRVTPHVLRHTAAKLRRQAGATIEEVSSLLGHQSIATTAIYLRRLEDERDDGWQPVAVSLGLADGRDSRAARGTATAAGSDDRSRPVQETRQDGWLHNRPAIWTGGVYAPLPQRDATPGGERGTRRRPIRGRTRRRRQVRPRRAGPASELSALRG